MPAFYFWVRGNTGPNAGSHPGDARFGPQSMAAWSRSLDGRRLIRTRPLPVPEPTAQKDGADGGRKAEGTGQSNCSPIHAVTPAVPSLKSFP